MQPANRAASESEVAQKHTDALFTENDAVVRELSAPLMQVGQERGGQGRVINISSLEEVKAEKNRIEWNACTNPT